MSFKSLYFTEHMHKIWQAEQRITQFLFCGILLEKMSLFFFLTFVLIYGILGVTKDPG